MSSFKRKGSVKQASVYPGTRPSPASPSTVITSTGIPSLDDLLGGGLPLSCSLLIAAPDLHSSYGDLIGKYFIAQGLNAGHDLCIIEENPESFVKDVMWVPPSRNPVPAASIGSEDEENTRNEESFPIKIAWRYEQMKPFRSTIESSPVYSAAEYCYNFDLTSRIPHSVVEAALQSGQLSFITIRPDQARVSKVLSRITDILKANDKGTSPNIPPLRICIPALGSPQWGDLTAQDILQFLHSLRTILRRHPYACASVSLSPHLSTELWGGSGWIQKLGWVSDAALTMSAFSADPSLTAIFPSYNGLLHIHTLPAPHTLLPPGDKFSALRGLSASTGATGGGENNLTFKSTRKRLIFETLHLDIEGGVGERRTTPSTIPDTCSDAHDHANHKEHSTSKTAFAAVEVALEDLAPEKLVSGINDDYKANIVPEPKQKKQKKKVVFRTDRPDLYDF